MPLFESLQNIANPVGSSALALSGEVVSSDVVRVDAVRSRSIPRSRGRSASPAAGGAAAARSPSTSNTALYAPGDENRATRERIAAALVFANSEVQCANPTCTIKTAIGNMQPNYKCAEFVARSLAAGGYVPGLDARTGPQMGGNSFSYYPWRGRPYSLWNVKQLYSYLKARPDFEERPRNQISAGCGVFGNTTGKSMGHVCIAIGDNVLACHNAARANIASERDFRHGVEHVVCPK